MLHVAGRLTLTLAVYSTAARPGMVFYSISDVTDKLLSPSEDPIPTLQEDFWIKATLMEPTTPLREVLEDLSPPAMAAFDLACCQCQLWKTCKQLLETAERRLSSSLESRGKWVSCTSLYACSFIHSLSAVVVSSTSLKKLQREWKEKYLTVVNALVLVA